MDGHFLSLGVLPPQSHVVRKSPHPSTARGQLLNSEPKDKATPQSLRAGEAGLCERQDLLERGKS